MIRVFFKLCPMHFGLNNQHNFDTWSPAHDPSCFIRKKPSTYRLCFLIVAGTGVYRLEFLDPSWS